MVEWLIKRELATDVAQAVRLGQTMYNQAKLIHVNRDTHFQNS